MLEFFFGSRCTLQQAAQRSGYSEQELQELIDAHMLECRRTYGIFGPYSIDIDEIEGARIGFAKIQEIQAEHQQHIEGIKAAITESQHRFQAQLDAMEAEAAWTRRIYARALKDLKLRFVPPHVEEAYHTFGLSSTDSMDTIQKHYRFLAKRYHPDTGGDQQKFIQLHTAYTTIVTWIKSLDEGAL